MNDLLSELIELSDKYFLTIYKVDIEKSTYLDILQINTDVLAENEYGDFFESFDMFDSIKKHLAPGNYFIVYKNFYGTEWKTATVVSKDEQQKIDKNY
jgi:hypothetical protein